jgi:hypothetical protein
MFGRKGKDDGKQRANVSAPDSAPGWDAITQHVDRLFPGVESVHWATARGVALGDPLQGIDAYRGANWWQYVTYGLTELFSKDSENRDVSGWGYELTMRAPADGPTPPEWPFGVLLSLAGLTQERQIVFGQNHRLQTGHPLAGLATKLTAIAFTRDPLLGAIDTPHGQIQFLLVVGITEEELTTMKASSTASVLEELAKTTDLVTDPRRAPV